MFKGELCSICKKRLASVFITQLDAQGHQINQGVCLVCAKKMGLPQVSQFLDKMGISDDDLENLTDEMSNMLENLNQEQETEDLTAAEADPAEETPADENHAAESRTNTPNLFQLFRRMGENDGSPAGQDGQLPMERPDGGTKRGPQEREERKNPKKPKYKFLSMYSTDLNDKAANGLIDNVVGRTREIDRVIQILNRRTKNNPVLIGEAGVGKTAIAEGLALKIVKQDVPYKLLPLRVHLLDLTAMVAGTQFRGQFEARMKGLIDEVKSAGNIILVIDEVHNIMGAGEAEGSLNAANILKPALSRGEIQVIGATTLKEYRKYIEKDGALERRFQPVYVNEPTIEETIEILKGIREHYETYHKVRISDGVINDAVRLSERYITDRFLPDKAIDVIDEAASRANLRNRTLAELAKCREELEQSRQRITELESREFANEEEQLESFKQIAEIKNRIAVLEGRITELAAHEYVDLLFDDVAKVIETWTGIPVRSVSEEEAHRLLKLGSRLREKVIGQDQAVEAVAKAIRRNRSGFRKRYKPSSFIFVGPTGVGKTELVKQLAIELFGTIDALIRLDMSEYMEKHTVSKLIGSPPGYVGYDEAGQLTEQVRRRPYSVILLDEIEKAHADVFNMLLQILDDGRLTDSQGRTVNFENTIIIMTSNAGNSIKSKGIGFANDALVAIEEHANDALKQIFRPEFLNRVDEVIVFHRLDKPSLHKIANLMLAEVYAQCGDKGIRLTIGDDVSDYLVEHGYDEKYGARPLRRLIQRKIEDELAELFLNGSLKAGDEITFKVIDDDIKTER